MEVTSYCCPPGCTLISAAGASVDGLAARYSAIAEDPASSTTSKHAAFLVSIAENFIVTSSEGDDAFQESEHAAREALGLAYSIGDGRSGYVARLVVHALCAQAAFPQAPFECLSLACDETYLATADTFVQDELTRFRLSGDQCGEACMLLSLAEIGSYKGSKAQQAVSWCEEAHRLFQYTEDEFGEGLTALVMASLHLSSHAYHLAHASAGEAAHLLKDNHYGVARAYFLLAVASRLQQKHAAVILAAKEALPHAQEVGNQRLVGSLLYLLALGYHEKGGRPREAAGAAAEAVTTFLELRCRRGWAEASLFIMVKVLLSERSHETALDAVKEHARRCRGVSALGPRLLVRGILLQILVEGEKKTEYGKAACLSVKTLTALRRVQDRQWLARELQLVCSFRILQKTQTHLQEARDLAQEARAELQARGDKHAEAEALPVLANSLLHLREDDKALKVLQERRGIFRDLGARSEEARAMRQIVQLLIRQQVWDDSRARKFLRDAFALAREAENASDDVCDEIGVANAMYLQSEIYLFRQEPEEAESRAREAEQLYRKAGESKLVAKAAKQVGRACCERDEPEEAARQAGEAVIFCKKAGDRSAEADMMSWEALMYTHAMTKHADGLTGKELEQFAFKNLSKIMTPAKESVILARKLHDKALVATCLCVLAELEACLGKGKQALAAAAEAAMLCQKIGVKTTESRALAISADVHYRKDEVAVAREQAERALRLAQESHCWETRRHAEKVASKVGGIVIEPF
eukprot:TRINITY_DN40660_c0_g1_i1.p1 TRINITY_DN40660_c0_g1~~TRINITY_DN40660_c0_g1_i1.p1  ORF type:complete len:758 (-),score=187.67 TRINITY_DN40660_c0_g1_i1:112-2385(-)